MKDQKLQLKAYRVVVSQATNENHSGSIAHAIHKLGFDHCISSAERGDLGVAIQSKRLVRWPAAFFGSRQLAKLGVLIAQLASLSELSGLSDFV